MTIADWDVKNLIKPNKNKKACIMTVKSMRHSVFAIIIDLIIIFMTSFLCYLFYFLRKLDLNYFPQGSHRLEKFLNIKGILKKSLKIKSDLKSTVTLKLSKVLDWFYFYGFNSVNLLMET